MSGIPVIGKGSSELNPTEETVWKEKMGKKKKKKRRKANKQKNPRFKFVKNVDMKNIVCKD